MVISLFIHTKFKKNTQSVSHSERPLRYDSIWYVDLLYFQLTGDYRILSFLKTKNKFIQFILVDNLIQIDSWFKLDELLLLVHLMWQKLVFCNHLIRFEIITNYVTYLSIESIWAMYITFSSVSNRPMALNCLIHTSIYKSNS